MCSETILPVLIAWAELLWPEEDEALSENAVGAVESILTLHAEHRPGALGTGLLLFNCKRINTSEIRSDLCMVFYSVLSEFQAHFKNDTDVFS